MKLSNENIKKILIIRNDHIGDLILSSNIFRYARKNFPDAKITALVAPSAKEIVEKNKNINEVITAKYNPKSYKDLKQYIKAILKIRKEKFDYGIEIRGETRNTLSFLFLGKVKFRVANCKDNLSKKLVDFHGTNDSKQRHESVRGIELFRDSLNLGEINYKAEVATDERDEENVNLFIKKNKLKKFICINPDASHEGKQWDMENFDKIIKFLKSDYKDYKIVLIGADSEKLNYLMTKNPEMILLEKGNLREIHLLLKKCSLFFCIDGGVMHLAWISDIPLITLMMKFSIPSIENIKPLSKKSIILYDDEDGITIDEAKENIRKVLR
ncbi:MAG: glycosyltransferase family 9 protein [Candidatus Pacearchaeota archaeon]